MAKRVISIELGIWWTKVVCTEYGKKAPQIYDMFSFRTPEHSVEDGYIRDKEGFAQALKEELAKRQIADRGLFFNINSTKVITREISLPVLKEKQLEGIVQTQAKEYFPMDISGCSISYRKMYEAYSDEGIFMRVLLIAVPDNLLSNYISFAESAGFTIEGFDYIGNSITSFVDTYFKEDGIVVQLEESETIVSVFSSNNLVFQRVAPNGYSMVMSAVMDHGVLGIDNEYEAFDYLVEHDILHTDLGEPEPGTDEERKAEAYADIADVLNYQTRVVMTALEYYKTQSKQDLRGKFYLIGSGAKIAGLAQVFREEIPVEYAEVNYKSLLRYSKRLSSKEVAGADFAAAFGATLRPLTIKSKEMREKESKKKTRKSTGIIFFGTAVVSAALITTGVMRYVVAITEHERLKRRIEELSYVQEIFNENQEMTLKEAQYMAFDALTRTDNERMGELMAQLEENLPSSVTVQSLSVVGSSITLSLASPDKLTAAQLLMNLKDIPFLDGVSLPAIIEGEDAAGNKLWQFSLTASYVEPEETEAEETETMETEEASEKTAE